MNTRIAIAGATGFIGRRLCGALRDLGFDVVGLGRSVQDETLHDGVHWRRADLFSLLDCERVLRDADVVIYLVHSMLPSARLTQASFEDMDLILADNVARAAAQAGARRIVYLGGLVPDDPDLSRHLESRREVETALAGHGVPVTTLRAGLVIGPHGSSFQILERLVRRLPAMLLPRWTRQRTQPIALDDVISLLVAVATKTGADSPVPTGSCALDIGGPDVVTYRQLIEATARALDLTRTMINLPVGSPTLSELWVTGVTGQPRQLTGPLIESLEHSMVAGDRSVQLALGLPGLGVDEAIQRAIEGRTQAPEVGVPRDRERADAAARERKVRSVQRMRLPPGRDAAWAARTYLTWLPHFLRPFLAVDGQPTGRCAIRLRALPLTLLELTWSPERSSPDRALLYVTGGILARVDDDGRGRLELRTVLDDSTLLAAIHDFEPRLPWPAYRLSQAQAHLVVMAGFRRFLEAGPDAVATAPSG